MSSSCGPCQPKPASKKSVRVPSCIAKTCVGAKIGGFVAVKSGSRVLWKAVSKATKAAPRSKAAPKAPRNPVNWHDLKLTRKDLPLLFKTKGWIPYVAYTKKLEGDIKVPDPTEAQEEKWVSLHQAMFLEFLRKKTRTRTQTPPAKDLARLLWNAKMLVKEARRKGDATMAEENNYLMYPLI
jgi:hypothetical protein